MQKVSFKFQMTAPRGMFFMCLAGALAVQSDLIRSTPEFVILLILVAAMWLYIDWLQASMERHQRALEWFQDHVFVAPHQDPEPPQELEDTVRPD